MASVADICNLALTHVGADNQITSISPPDGSMEAGYCARFYPLARTQTIEDVAPAFAKTRVELAQVTNPSTVWTYAYALPSDCLKPLRVLPLSTLSELAASLTGSPVELRAWSAGMGYTEAGTSAFTIEGGVLLTHEPNAVLVYLRDVTDTTKFGSGFVDALAKRMAGYIAPPIIKGLEGARVGATWHEQARQAVERAAADDANDGAEFIDPTPAGIAARA